MLCMGASAYAADTYSLVTDATTLADGDKIIIVSGTKALGTTQNSNNRNAVDVTVANDAVEPGTNVQIITLESSETAGQFYMKVGDNSYLYAASSSKNYLRSGSKSSVGANGSASFTSSGNNTTIKFNGSNTRNQLRFNSSNNPPIFACYSTGQSAVAVYRLEDNGGTVVSVAKPTFELIEGEYSFTLAMAAEEGCKIYYTTDGTEPTIESALYSAPVEVWTGAEVKAIAVNEAGELSSVATFNEQIPFLIENFDPLVDAYDMLGGDVNFILKGLMTVVYEGISTNKSGSQNSYLYLKSGDSYMLLFGYEKKGYAAGTTFTRLEGTYTIYNGLPEVKNYTLGGEQGTGDVIEPEFAELYMVGNNMLNRYVTFENVIVDAKAKTATSEDGDVLALYYRFDSPEMESGKMNLTGFVARYDKDGATTIQLYPTDFVLKLAGIEHQPTVGVIFAKFDYTLHVNNYDEDYDNFTVELHVDGAKADECTEHTLVAEPQAAPALREAAFNATHKLAGTVKATGLKGGTDYAAKLVVKHGNDIVKEQAADFTTGGTVGIEDVTVEGNEAAEYFNLQGVRVAQPEAGQVYIVRRGEKASKELVK